MDEEPFMIGIVVTGEWTTDSLKTFEKTIGFLENTSYSGSCDCSLSLFGYFDVGLRNFDHNS